MSEFRRPQFNKTNPLKVDVRGTLPESYYTRMASLAIKSLLSQKGMTQEDLAKKLGISRKTLSERINDPRKFTSTEVETICVEFGVTLDYLRGETMSETGTGPLSPSEVAMFYEHHLTPEQRSTISSMVREMVGHNAMRETISVLLGFEQPQKE